MTAIWQEDQQGWRLLSPKVFPAEADLHGLVEQAPHLLPLSGTPQLVVLGKEVLLGGNYADLIAIEPSGRLAIIEIKLANNAEARRAVVAQILTYAAYLRGIDVGTLESTILGKHLASRGFNNLSDAARSNDQENSFDTATFEGGLRDCLARGAFRLVLVLDRVPDELVRLVGYLEAVAETLVIDLVTVSSYEVADSQIVVPQRVDPERTEPKQVTSPPVQPTSTGQFVEGADDFEAAIAASPQDYQPLLRKLTDWAKSLEEQGLVRLGTYHGITGRLTLLPRLHTDNVGLVTIWNDNGPYLQFHRSVFERRAPKSLPHVEHLVSPTKVGKGTTTKVIDDQLLSALTDAYLEAASGHVNIKSDDSSSQ